MTKKVKNLIVVVVAVAASLLAAGSNKVYADCEPTYGGGETCVWNKSFRITKDVRIEGDDDWEDKVTDVAEDETVEFRIRIKNVGEIEVDNMKMKDILPDELIKIGGSGLTEEWDDFEPGETKEFIIKVKVDSEEYDRENFEKCVVNKAEAFYKDKFEGADTATVCYGEGEISELPETGAGSFAFLNGLGLGLVSLGTMLKKKVSKIVKK
jgi:uncharacterized repeat protein (TIGR01451 family)